MKTNKTLSRVGAGALAVATVVAGLSFGPAAANAASSTLVGKVVVSGFDTANPNATTYGALTADGGLATDYTAAAAAARGSVWSIPAPGTQGQIRAGDKCMIYYAGRTGAEVGSCSGTLNTWSNSGNRLFAVNGANNGTLFLSHAGYGTGGVGAAHLINTGNRGVLQTQFLSDPTPNISIAQIEVPTLAQGQTGTVKLRVSNSGTGISGEGLVGRFEAPEGTTFSSNVLTTNYTGGSDTSTGTLSNGDKTLTVSTPPWSVHPGSAISLEVNIKANTPLTQSGNQNSGKLVVTGGGMLPAGTTNFAYNAQATPAPNVSLSRTSSPTLAQGQTGDVEFTATNTGNAQPSGAQMVFNAPSGTTFNSASASWITSRSGDTWESMSGTLSNGNKTLIIASGGFRILQDGGYSKIKTTLKADTPLTQSGSITNGTLKLTGAAVGSEKTTSIGYTAQATAPAPNVSLSRTSSPTLAEGQTGDVEFTATNAGNAQPSGAQMVFNAPSGTTFNSASASWITSRTDDTWESMSGTLSNGNRTLIIASGGFRILQDGGYSKIKTTLKADRPLTQSGSITDGTLKLTGAAVGSEKTTSIGYTAQKSAAADVDIQTATTPTLEAGQTGRMGVWISNNGGSLTSLNGELHAPTGTTFSSNKVERVAGPAEVRGTWTGTLSSDKKTLRFSDPSFVLGETSFVHVLATVTADTPLLQDGKVSDGSFTISSNSFSGFKSAALEYTAKRSVAPVTAQVSFDADVNKRAVVSGTGQPGASIIVSHNGAPVGDDVVDIDGKYSIEIPAPNAGGTRDYTVRQDASGAISSATVTADFGAAVAITTPSDADVVAPGIITVRGTGVAGGTVELTKYGSSDVIGTADVESDGTWKVEDVRVKRGEATFIATQTGKGNNSTVSHVTVNPGQSTNAPLIVTSPVNGAVLTQDTNQVRFSGTGEPGAQVRFLAAGGTRTVFTATVDEHGNWERVGQLAFDVPYVLDTEYTVPGEQTVKGTHAVTVHQAGVSLPLAVTTPADFATVVSPDQQVTFTGKGTTGADIQVQTTGGRVVGSAKVDANGNWSTSGELAYDLMYDLRVVSSGKATATIATHVKLVRNAVTQPLSLTAPADQAVVVSPDQQVTFTGKGTSDAVIQVKTSGGRVVGTGKVDDQGNWKISGELAYDLMYELYVTSSGTGTGSITTHVKLVRNAGVTQPLSLTAPADQAVIVSPDKQVTFTGKGTSGADVQVQTSGGRVVGTALVDDEGNWSITGELAHDLMYELTVSSPGASAGAGAGSIVTHVKLVAKKPIVVKPFTVNEAGDISAVKPGTYRFTGTGAAGSKITIFNYWGNADGRQIGSTVTVAEDGTWEFTGTLVDNLYYQLRAQQIAGPDGGENASSVFEVQTQG